MPNENVSAAWNAARRILCVRPGGLGGLLMCTPALRALRAAVPGRRLTLLAGPAGAAGAPYIPEIGDVVLHRAGWMREACGSTGAVAGAAAAEADRTLAVMLAARAFDAAIVFTGFDHDPLPAARLCRMAGIPLRLAHGHDNPDGLLTDWAPDPEPAATVRHEVQRQLALVRRAGATATVPATTPACACAAVPAVVPGAASALSFVPRPRDVAAARNLLRAAGIDPDGRWLLLHPGAGAPAHRYPAGHWAAVVRLLAERPGLPLVLTGSAAHIPLVDGILRAVRARSGVCAGTGAHLPADVPAHVPLVSLAGKLDLGELGAALALASVAVAGNTGAAHIAAAVGTPLVNLYALTGPQHTPWAVPNRVLFADVPCRFCRAHTCPVVHHGCLAGVAPERVADAVLALLDARRPRGRQPAIPGTEALWPTEAAPAS